MKFIASSSIPNNATFVVMGANAKEMGSHQFVGVLSRPDRAYFTVALRGESISPSFTKSIILSSGRKILLVGIPEKNARTHRKAILLIRRVIAFAKADRINRLVVALPDFSDKTGSEVDMAELLAMQSELAHFEFLSYKEAPKKEVGEIREIVVWVSAHGIVAIQKALNTGSAIGQEINGARALSNTPGGDMTPARLAAEAQRVGTRYGIRVRVLGESEMKKLGMGGVLGVARGSSAKPRFIILEYMKGKKSEAPTVLVGKGITFDTGGLNLKPSQFLYEMHMDMSGGAAVIHTIAALARLKVKKNVVGLVPAAENMPSGSSYRPGDVLRTMSGKTIEVLDTDAEGRVVLADGLSYAKKYDPALVIDIATLTGAAEVALGRRASALFATDEKITKQFIASGEAMGDYVWPLPLWEEYEEEVKGTFGDVANIGKMGRAGGAITGAVFLWQFIKPMKHEARNMKQARDGRDGEKEIAWVHLDIAPRMTSIEGDYLAKGAAGASIALLVRFLRQS